MLNNEQLYEAQASGGEMVCTESWKDNTLCKMKTDIIDESFVNETDIEDVMNKIKNNDGRFVTSLEIIILLDVNYSHNITFCKSLICDIWK